MTMAEPHSICHITFLESYYSHLRATEMRFIFLTLSYFGLFTDAYVTLHHPQIGESCEDILDNILIRNGVAKEMNADLMKTSSHEEVEGTSVPPLQLIQETGQEEKSLVQQDSVLRSCLASAMLVVPRNKRTRGGERKASSWCKKHLSDPESQ